MSEAISWAGFAYQYRAIVEKAEDAHRKMKTNRPSAASEKYHYALGRRQGMEDAIKSLQGYHSGGEVAQFLADVQGLIPANAQCPYLDCTFRGSEEEVDEHRCTGVHNDQPQAGSNLS